MTFEELLANVVDWLQRSERVSYRAIKRQFDLDDEYLEDLKEAILFAHAQVVDEEGRGLVWTGTPRTTPESISEPIPSKEAIQANQNTQLQSQQSNTYTPDAELRQLTVMFCDLAESTRLSGQLDPEDYREVVRAYQSACDEAIQSYEGYIAQHLGDGVLIYFGFPQAHEDDALRAVRAGLDIIKAISLLNAQLQRNKGIRIEVRIGVHTGPVVVGQIGAGARLELLALGETPNIAARTQGIAAPNTVAVSSTTFKMVEGYFTAKDLGLQTVKGIAAPMQIYSILALWYLGYPDRALQKVYEAVSLAQELSHPLSLSGAHHFASWLHLHRREGRPCQEQTEAAMTIALQQDFGFFIAFDKMLRGRSLAMQGRQDEGIAEMRQGLAAYQAMGAEALQLHWRSNLAEVYGKAGRVEEGLAVLADAQALTERNGSERWFDAELYRLKGELRWQKARNQGQEVKFEAEVEACFQQAIEIARQQTAKSWELRASMSLSRLWQKQRKKAKAFRCCRKSTIGSRRGLIPRI